MATSGLDLDAYFASRQSKSVDDKLSSLAAATRNKLAGLQAFKAEADQWRVQRAAEEEASKNSWAGKLGLEPESFTGNTINAAASVVAGTSRLAGHIASLPVNAVAMASTMGATEQEYAAYNRSLAGTSLAGDEALLDTARDGGLSARARFENAEVLRRKSRGINETMDLSKIVEQTNRNNLNKDLGEGFDANWGKITSGKVGDTLAGVAGLAANTGSALLSNPMGLGEVVLENAPQLFVGALGKVGQVAMAASNAGYAADTYSQGFENYQKKNGGQLPSQEWRDEKALQSAGLALAEQGGDMAGLALAGLKKKATAEMLKTSFKESLKNITKAGSGAFATEAITEGIQTHLEGEITGKPATAKDIYIAGAIGGASGSALSGGVRTLAEMSGATAEHAAVRQQTAIDKEVLETAADKGDVTSYMDKTSPNYSPGKAVEVLFKHSQKEDTTPEQRAANTTKADEIVAGLETERLSAERNLALSTIAGTKKAISDYETQLSDMAPNDPDREVVQAAIDIYQGNLVDKETNGENPVAVKAHREKLAQLDGQLEQVNKSRAALNIFNKGNDDVASLVSMADTAIETVANGEQDAPAVGSAPRAEATESVNKVITLAMRSPEKVSDAQAKQLADNHKNGLTEAQRTFLRAFSEERVANNVLMSMDKVSQEVYQGGGTNIGMSQHRAALRAALTTGDPVSAGKTLQTLEKFAKSHVVKAALGKSAPAGAQIMRDKQGEWFVLPSNQPRKSDAQMRENGGYTNNSPELVTRIGNEANALAKMVTAAKAAYALKFEATAPTTGVENVPNTSQRVSAQSGQNKTQATETTKVAEPSGKQGTVAAGTSDGTTAAGTNGKVDAVKEVVVAAKEAPSSSVVTETAQKAESSKPTGVTQSTENSEVNSNSDEETDLDKEDRLEKEAAAVEKERVAKVTDLDRRIVLLEKLKTCMGG